MKIKHVFTAFAFMLGSVFAVAAGVSAHSKVSQLHAEAPTVAYLKPSANWQKDGARFATYFFGNGETWADMEKVEGKDYYKVDLPSGYSKMIFTRMNPAKLANNWDNKWNQSADLDVPTEEGKNYAEAPDAWDSWNVTWAALPGEEPTPTPTEPIPTPTPTPTEEPVLTIRGSIASLELVEDWAKGNEVAYNEEAGQYELLGLELAKEDEFKFVFGADQWMGYAQLGNDDSRALFEEEDNLVVKEAGDYNFYVKPGENAIYVTKVEEPTPTPTEPILKVAGNVASLDLVSEPEQEWAMKEAGSYNKDKNELVLENVVLTADDEFKFVVGSNWYGYGELGNDDSKALFEEGDNLIVKEAGKYSFYLNLNDGKLYVAKVAEAVDKATAYAEAFNDALAAICKADNTTDQAALKEVWDAQAAAYKLLDEDVKEILINSSSTDGVEAVRLFEAKYEYIYARYGVKLGLENYLGKVIEEINIHETANVDGGTIAIILAATSLVTASALAAMLILKKKRFSK